MENNAFNRHNPAFITIKERFPLTKEGSTKSTFHVVLDTSQVSLPFKVGDSLALYPQNDPLLVSHLTQALRAQATDRVKDPKTGCELSLKEFLTHKANLSRLTSSFLKLLYEYEPSHDKKNQLSRLLHEENRLLLTQYLSSHDPLDLFKEYKGNQAPLDQLCAQFGPLLPRFYSIASSSRTYPHEIHLTVALTTFTHQGEQRYGVASHFLSALAKPQETPIPVYVQPTSHFHLPSDDTLPLILIGPGTGIAPYRAFLQERIATGARGKHWLFFGERCRATDYLYEEDIEQWRREGHLEVDLAFSRDQPEKLYVQHLMRAKQTQLWRWLQEGALLYVCGDAHHMAKDVDLALHQIAQDAGHLTPEAAKTYIKGLRSSKRYLTDVY